MAKRKVEIKNGKWFIKCDCGARVEVGSGGDSYSWAKPCKKCGDTIQVYESGTYKINSVYD